MRKLAQQTTDRRDRQGGTTWPVLTMVTKQPPTACLQDRVFGCSFEDGSSVANCHTIGISQLMSECDYPQQDATWPQANEVIPKVVEEVWPEELEMIPRGNAIRVLRLDPGRFVGV
jgi:hypothetical protein